MPVIHLENDEVLYNAPTDYPDYTGSHYFPVIVAMFLVVVRVLQQLSLSVECKQLVCAFLG